ncbi:MAG TPA: DUF535 family protein [Terracidiphilus sp.]|nr:DUF535 family protein [Terracidiphilus sp.]
MYIHTFLRMARNPYFWSPLRLKRVVSILGNFPRQIEILRILADPAFQGLVRSNPVLPFKYLSNRYLVRGLTSRQRASCFIHHYRQLGLRFSPSFLHRMAEEEIALLQRQNGDNTYVVSIGFPSGVPIWEGEILLHLLVNGVEVYALQFTIVPGWFVNSAEESVLMVLRLQGVKGGYDQIYSATKEFRDVAPPALLIAALQGIANAWGIRRMAGVTARSQYSYTENCAEVLRGAYDDFFLELGAEQISPDFFLTSLPLPEKPIERITRCHRPRAKRKRVFKASIADEVRLNLLELCPASCEPARAAEQGAQVTTQPDACSVA